MTPQEMGIVFNEFMNRKMLCTGPFPTARKTETEREALRIISRQHSLTDFEEFLETQGLKLMTVTLDAYGLGDGTAYVLLRDPRFDMPEHLTPERIMRELSDGRRQDTDAQIAIWSTFMLFVLMWFFYSKLGRGIEQVSLFDQAIISVDEFANEIEERIESLRLAPEIEGGERVIVWSTITSANASMIKARGGGFLQGLMRVGYLERVQVAFESNDQASDILYRQTLPSALDIAEHFENYAGLLLRDAARRRAAENDQSTPIITTEVVAEAIFVRDDDL